MSQQLHHPPHIYLNDTWYIITSSVFERRPLLQPEGYKEIVRDKLKELVKEFHMQLTAWIILDNHYHILVKSKDGKALTRFIGRLHGSTSFELNGRDGIRGRRVWRNFWDTCIRSERDYWTRFNYIHHNPIKHGYVLRTGDWPYSSYGYYLEHKRAEWLDDIFAQYPIKDFTDADDNF